MSKIFLCVLAALLASCALQPIQYDTKPVKDQDQAVKIIEQVLFEQPIKVRPEKVFISDDFLAFSSGNISKSKTKGVAFAVTKNVAVGRGSIKTLSKDINHRLYFNAMSYPILFNSDDWYMIQLIDKKGQILHKVYTDEESKAHRFIDAIVYFTNTASEFGQ